MSDEPTRTTGYQFGTFKGVYIPSLLTILGVVMYLRLGWVVGQVGVFGTLTIVTIASAITFLTSLSIAALASNMRVGGGGAYYIISRSLGVEAGAAVGLPLFLAQALGISFYIAGFSESVAGFFPSMPPQVIGLITLGILAIVAYCSADLALRAQSMLLAVIMASLASFFLGSTPSTATMVTATPLRLEPFWAVFAVFFPAVTGIEAGLAMSGDLKRPSYSLPRGTVAAVLTGYVVYMAIPIFLIRVIPDRELLLRNPLVMHDVARWGFIILAGIWGAALSSGLNALLGAPRTLQALARDGVVPRFLARSFGRGNDPRYAVAASFLIALCGILSGGLNELAPFLTTFFLTSYGLLNLSAAFGGMISSPSWRPEFRLPWPVSMMGAMGCLMVMFMINPGATFVATFLAGAVYLLMRQRGLRAYWGDMRYGILMLGARYALYTLVSREPDERTWRPNLLVLSGSPMSRWYLIALADAISHGKGFLTVVTIVPEKVSTAERLESVRMSMREYLAKRRVPALIKVQTAEDIFDGVEELINAYGFGPIVPNTIVLGETENPEHMRAYAQLVQHAYRRERNLIMVRESHAPPRGRGPRRIDVWWRQDSPNANLMLALAYLLQTSPEWRDTELRLMTIVDNEVDQEEARKGLTAFMLRSRIEGSVDVLVRNTDNAFAQMQTASAATDLAFLGMRHPARDETPEAYRHYYEDLMERTKAYPPIAIVLAAEGIQFDRIFETPS